MIVNADDFGRSAGINAGVVKAHEDGIVTSASLMVRWPAAADASAYARLRPELSVGLHVDLGEWHQAAGRWEPVYERVESDRSIAQELRDQLELFRDLVGCEPTHLDSHQHVHRTEPARTAIAMLATELGVPARELTSHATYRGDFYGQSASGEPYPEALTPASLEVLLHSCRHEVTELGCHPAAWMDFVSSYDVERLAELDVLCSEEVRHVLASNGIELVSYHDELAVRSERKPPYAVLAAPDASTSGGVHS
jgi:predicted glycoside hydrolase/deacetylase ChbG (UPF0249 family)